MKKKQLADLLAALEERITRERYDLQNQIDNLKEEVAVLQKIIFNCPSTVAFAEREGLMPLPF